jgi:hypothetical protein
LTSFHGNAQPKRWIIAVDICFDELRIMDLIKPNFEEGGVGDIVPHKGATPP